MTKAEKLHWLKEWYLDHKAELQTQPAMVKAIKSNNKVESIIRDLYLELFMKTLGGCGSCLADGLIVLINYSNKKIDDIMNCQYKLKTGVLLQGVEGLPMATAANITDELAEAYLRDNARRAIFFESLPDNWEERIKKRDLAGESSENVKVIAENAEAAQIEENTAETQGVKKTYKRKYTK